MITHYISTWGSFRTPATDNDLEYDARIRRLLV